MKLLLLVLFFIRLSSAIAESQKGSFHRIIIYSCETALYNYKFDCQGYQCRCTYTPFLGSIASCIDHYSPDPRTRSLAVQELVEFCGSNHGQRLSVDIVEGLIRNSSKWLQDPLSEGFNKDEVKYVPVLPLKNQLDLSLRDYKAFLGNFDFAQDYGIYLNYYWLLVLLYIGIWNRFKSKRFINKLIGEPIDSIRSNLTLPIIFNRHFQPFTYLFNLTSLLPSSSDALILLGYLILHTVYLFKNFDIYNENKIFNGNLIGQFIRYISDRSGVLSFAHLPIIILFAGRNNLLIKISKLSYSSFMIFHKWTARIMFIDAFIHTCGYYEIIISRGTLFKSLRKEYIQWGTVAIFIGLVILVQAIHNFRIAHYELFLILHIIFAAGFLITCWKHVETFGWKEWIYGACAFWALDRIIRIINLCKFGTPWANLKFISDETFIVKVSRPTNWKPFPGCFVYIHFLHWSMFWQSHPFTIVDSVLKDEEITIYIKAKDGLTQKVLNMIGHDNFQMRVALEGPYGNQSSLEQYQTALLIAGGNGIPGPFYHALELSTKPLLLKQRVKLIWVIRNIESLEWFEEELMKLCEFNIEIDIYITRNFNYQMSDTLPMIKKFSTFIKFYAGRANFNKILNDEFINSQGSIGIVTCGPPIMCDDIRSFTARNLRLSPYRIDLFEELQVW
ncbi:Ferric reductase transmembrane component [Wickerhamomyces ciferrii]|uniref:ferric-chelate reductase (NADPH) n=1 Tax=Wickerhamomyces ciferrii (strain ATCC 14091 / BCRC 22168 / CBS 111 / JCM 3599 / NBRC 0793 / NRRL Y-1031 F-60-10) TaxID=1206466 RepID=K0KP15_WICCF|nr:Ferric reductase transmembrane component [Wickerhamomyces ciferrii]CCH47020.1 Ferric reductase transmembrane component [Wickerhamomyces ciferrii]